MEKKQNKAKFVVTLMAVAGLLWALPQAIAGNLEPSAPPGPTMKTLHEVEPRNKTNKEVMPMEKCCR